MELAHGKNKERAEKGVRDVGAKEGGSDIGGKGSQPHKGGTDGTKEGERGWHLKPRRAEKKRFALAVVGGWLRGGWRFSVLRKNEGVSNDTYHTRNHITSADTYVRYRGQFLRGMFHPSDRSTN